MFIFCEFHSVVYHNTHTEIEVLSWWAIVKDMKMTCCLATNAWYLLFQEGRTALHYAALNGHAAIVQLIGAETNDIDLQDKVSVAVGVKSSTL